MIFNITNNHHRILVFNQLSGAVLITDKQWWQELDLNWLNGPLNRNTLPSTYALENQYRPNLEELGFLLTPALYDTYIQNLTEFGNRFKKERQTTFFVTPQTQHRGCPLNCGYCFEKNAKPEEEKLLQAGGPEKIVAFIKRYQEQNNLPSEKICLQLFGGEPVQDRFHDFWKHILNEVRSHGWRWAVVTSGATFTTKMMDLFEAYANDGLQEFNITVDGVSEIHDKLRPFKSGEGTHFLVVKNVDELLRRGLPVLLKTNFGRDNIDYYQQHLDFVIKRGWHKSNFVLMVNVIQPFGGIDVGDQKISEEVLMLKVIDIFRKEPYRELVPQLRLEGKKLTGYLANSFSLPFPDTVSIRKGKPVFDGYPYHAFCNPTKGNSWNIAPNGALRACNWMNGHEGFDEGSIFDGKEVLASRYTNHVFCNNHCSQCDINTLCGGGCPIDMKVRPDYYQTCRDEHGSIIRGFIEGVIERGLLNLELNDPFKILKNGFDLEYQYRDRFNPATRISDPH